MNTSIGVTRRGPSWSWLSLLGLAFLASVAFIVIAAIPYFLGDEAKLGRYVGRQGWLFAHISGGMVALLLGPFQLWLGANSPRNPWHRKLGMVYLGVIAISCVAAYYLAFHTDVSFTFGFGLAGLATAWVITCATAMLAVKRRQFVRHQEWMIRSYVVTFAFVSFRALVVALTAFNVGELMDRLNVASWACWAIPLMICEAIIQGRKLKPVRRPQTRQSRNPRGRWANQRPAAGTASL